MKHRKQHNDWLDTTGNVYLGWILDLKSEEVEKFTEYIYDNKKYTEQQAIDINIDLTKVCEYVFSGSEPVSGHHHDGRFYTCPICPDNIDYDDYYKDKIPVE